MPTYDYECTVCGHTFELFQSIVEPPRKKCPKCRRKVKRLLGAGAGIIFKGSGFYETDYKRKVKTEAKTSPSTTDSSTSVESSSIETKKKVKTGES